MNQLLITATFFFLCFSTSVCAQTSSKIRLIITDTYKGKTNTIDTLLPAKININDVLNALGYSENQIKSMSEQRSVDIKTQEIEVLPSVTTKHKQLNEDKAPVVPGASSPQNKILISNTTANGNIDMVEKELPTSNIKKPTNKPTHISSGILNNIQNLSPSELFLDDVYQMGKTETVQYANSNFKNITITTSDCDVFDTNTLNQKDNELVNAKPLHVYNLSLSPNYNEGFFNLQFNCTEKKPTWIQIFDIVGVPVYIEFIPSFDGSFSKMLSKLSLLNKNTYLIAIKQEGTKYTQKIVID